MGVSGTGKTSLGKHLSQETGWPFYDADDFHSNTNIEKMSTGVPLDDLDRLGWLQKIVLKINESDKNNGAIFACSALKEKYREILSDSCKKKVKFIFLKIDKSEVAKRLKIRKNHFFPIGLLDNQFEILENPSNAIKVNASNDSISNNFFILFDLILQEISF